MNKVVLKVDLYDGQIKRKVLRAVSDLWGVDSIAADMKENKLTVIGLMDPTAVVNKVRKLCCAEILTVGPDKEKTKEVQIPTYNPCPAYYPHPSYYVPVTACEENPNSCTVC